MQRRDLLKSAVGLTILKSGMLKGQNAPSNKLNIALMGVWGRGTAHYNVLRNENVVALCDVNDNRTKEALELFPKAKTAASMSTAKSRSASLWKKCVRCARII
jgi:hypothetical protein